ncbi:MAG: hypothetical protein KBF99_21225 [Leptospiraceae bacterium]|nr:hypothetical protein [Leptospiraceae bacterium]MBK9502007.1 hypothetical protein [Leptospiraceae bacterium]MBP9165721.1 hypothetical protein [Leptospiraceae bacterium]
MSLKLLKIIHSEEVIKSRRGSYEFWNKRSEQEIIESFELFPLFVKDDGRIMNGNTRMYILQERGIDINSLNVFRNTVN